MLPTILIDLSTQALTQLRLFGRCVMLGFDYLMFILGAFITLPFAHMAGQDAYSHYSQQVLNLISRLDEKKQNIEKDIDAFQKKYNIVEEDDII